MPRQKKSEIWENYFHSANRRSVQCKHCKTIYQIGNVNKMTCHLLKCIKCPTAIKNNLMKMVSSNESSIKLPLFLKEKLRQLQQQDTLQDNNLSSTQNELLTNRSKDLSKTNSGAKQVMSAERKQHLDRLFSKAILVSGTPLSIVEHTLWVQVFEKLEPLYKLPTREAILTVHLEAMYEEIAKEITEELISTNDLHLQLDSRTNQRNEGVINLFIRKSDSFFVKSLNTVTDQNTSKYICEEIIKIMNKYGDHKFVTIIGDNNNDIIQRAFGMVKDAYPHVVPLNCVVHSLHLLCGDCLRPAEVKAFISNAIDIIKAIKTSQTMSDLLDPIMKGKNSGEKLKLPNKTRWGSYCTALKSLKNSRQALQKLAVHKAANITQKIRSFILDINFWAKVDDCINILEPITEKILKYERNELLINEVYKDFRDIKSRLNIVLSGISTLDDENKQDLMDAVTKRTESCVSPIHYAAHMLDPRSHGIELEEEHEVAAMEFICDMSGSLNIDVGVDLAKYKAKQGLWSHQFMWKSISEIEPVVWWKGLCSSTLLSKVAARILTAPCTSSPSVRIISTQPHISNGLTTDQAEKITFISYNENILHKDDEKSILLLSNPMSSSRVGQEPSTSHQSQENIEFCDVTDMISDDSD